MPARRPTSPIPTPTTCRSPASGRSTASSRTSPTSSSPMKGRFAPVTIETAYLYNDKAKKKAYYAFPIKQQTLHIQYWKDMLGQAGFKENDIPGTWKEYWSFWCDKVQPGYRKATSSSVLRHRQPDGRGVDRLLPVVPELGRRLQRQAGRRCGQAAGRRSQGEGGPVTALTDYTAATSRAARRPSSTTWKDPDNNVAFHNKTIVMTHNYTISIAAKWLDDANNEALTRRAARRRPQGLRRADRDRRASPRSRTARRWSTAPPSRSA